MRLRANPAAHAWCALLLAAAACASAPRIVIPPLEAEGEIYLEARPPEREAPPIKLAFQSISALRADGTEIPLRVLRAQLGNADAPFPRLIAWGRLEPGIYSGFVLDLGKPDPAAPARADRPVGVRRVEAPFKVERRRAVVMQLRTLPGRASEDIAELAGQFTAAPVTPSLPVASGFVSNAGQHNLSIFDKRARSLSGITPTGRAPWGVAFDPVRQRIYVALSQSDQVEVYDATLLESLGSIQLRPGDAPREIALTPDGLALVCANSGSNSVSFVDPAAMVEVGRVQVDQEPTSVVMDRTGSRAYVSNARGKSVSVLDVPNRALAGSIATDYGPLRVQINRAGNRLLIATVNSPYVVAYSLPGLSPAGQTYVGLGITALKLDPATDLLYVAQHGTDRLAVYTSFSDLPIDTVEVGGDATYMAISDAENTLFVLIPEHRTIAAFDLAGKRRVGQIDTGYEPRAMALSGERN